MRLRGTNALLCSLLFAGVSTHAQSTTAPLPNFPTLIQRATVLQTNYARVRQHYHCYYSSKGAPTRDRFGYSARIYESFFYKGREVTRTIALGGHRLSDDLKPAEQERVNQQELRIDALPQTSIASLPGGTSFVDSKRDWQDSIEAAILRNGKFSNERRVLSSGRPLIEADFSGQPNHKAATDAEIVAASTVGTIDFDEQDGALVSLEGRITRMVLTHGRFIADPRITISYRATRINDELYVPSLWSDGTIDTGGNVNQNKMAWNVYSMDTVELVGCEEEHVTSTIHPTPAN